MQLLRHRTRTMRTTIETALLSVLLLFPLTALSAMERLDDASMADVSGAGLAMAFDDILWMIKPTSYFHNVGSDPNHPEWKRGDLRWYGVNISGAEGTTGTHWDEASYGGFGTPCDGGALSCPRGGPIDNFAAYDNPYVLRAFSPVGIDWDGTELNAGGNADKTIYEYLAPTSQPNYTYSWWGEIESDRTGPVDNLASGQGELLKTQNIIRGNAAGSIFRLFQFTEPGNQTFAIFYHSYLRGSYRLSASQVSGKDSDVAGVPVMFDGDEGMHFKGVEAFIPLGQNFYQAMVIDAYDNLGNIQLEIPRIANEADVYDNFYALRDTDIQGYETARLALQGSYAGNDGSTTEVKNYKTSHGYSYWGDWYPDCNLKGSVDGNCAAPTGTRNSYNSNNDGIYYNKCSQPGCENIRASARTVVDVRIDQINSSNPEAGYTYSYYDSGLSHVSGSGQNAHISSPTINVGDARAMGMTINYLSFTSCLEGGACSP